MPDVKFRLTGENIDLKSKISEVLEAMNKVGAGTGLESFGLNVARFLTNPLTLAAAAVGAVVALIKKAVDQTQEITRLAARGMSDRQAAGFIQGAELVGAQPEQLMGMMNMMKRAQALAMSDETSAQAKAFKELGLSMNEVEKAVPLELFLKLTKVLGDGSLSGTRFSAMTRILGRDFTALSIAAQAGLAGKIEESIALGPSDEALQNARDINKTLREGGVELKDTLTNAGFTLLGILNNFTKHVAERTYSPLFKKDTHWTEAELEKYSPAWIERWKNQKPTLGRSEQQEQELKDRQAEAAEQSRQRRERVQSLEMRAKELEEPGFQKISVDRFAKMGLYITSGSEKLANELVILNRQSLGELKKIKMELHDLKQGSEMGSETF